MGRGWGHGSLLGTLVTIFLASSEYSVHPDISCCSFIVWTACLSVFFNVLKKHECCDFYCCPCLSLKQPWKHCRRMASKSISQWKNEWMGWGMLFGVWMPTSFCGLWQVTKTRAIETLQGAAGWAAFCLFHCSWWGLQWSPQIHFLGSNSHCF